MDNFIQTLYFLAGKDDWYPFKQLCDELNIKAFFIFDLDVISVESKTFSKYCPEIEQHIQKLGKEIVRENKQKASKEKRCDNLLDQNLTEDEIKVKNIIFVSLKKENIYILKNGLLENYFDKNGQLIEDSKKDENTTELANIFQYVMNE